MHRAKGGGGAGRWARGARANQHVPLVVLVLHEPADVLVPCEESQWHWRMLGPGSDSGGEFVPPAPGTPPRVARRPRHVIFPTLSPCKCVCPGRLLAGALPLPTVPRSLSASLAPLPPSHRPDPILGTRPAARGLQGGHGTTRALERGGHNAGRRANEQARQGEAKRGEERQRGGARWRGAATSRRPARAARRLASVSIL